MDSLETETDSKIQDEAAKRLAVATVATVRGVLRSDTENPQKTRPFLIKGLFFVVAFVVVMVTALWSYAVYKMDDEMITVVMNGWPFVLAVITPLIIPLHSYFGVLKQEHKARLDAAGGITPSAGVSGLLSALIKK